MHRHALLAEVEREWEVGLRLGFLAEDDGSLPGFMGTGAGAARPAAFSRQSRLAMTGAPAQRALPSAGACSAGRQAPSLCAGLCDESGKFRGMLLERLNGRLIEKVIMQPDFADVHYLHALLLSVFTALGKAQAWLGAPRCAAAGRPLPWRSAQLDC